jgi:hypothetical protein
VSALAERQQTFGRQLLATTTVADIIALEAGREQAETFRRFDEAFAALIKRSLAGERVCRAVESKGRRPTGIEIIGLAPEDATFIETRFGYENQRSRGAWYLKPDARLELGLVNVGAHLVAYPRVFWNAVLDETVKASLVSRAGSVLVWSWLEAVFRRLAAPLYLRGSGLGELSREEQASEWARAESDLVSLGIDPVDALGLLRYGAAWGRLNVGDQLAAKQRYIAYVRERITPTTVARLRALLTRPLIERYYEKAKSDRPVLRRIAVTKALEPVLSGVFGGDWLAFLTYVEERPHPKEQVATELPKPILHVEAFSAPSSQQTQPSQAVDQTGPVTPPPTIAEKLEFLRRYWDGFDQLHSQHKHGMDQLSGLIPQRFLVLDATSTDASRDTNAFPTEFVDPIISLWRTMVVPRWPEVIVSEPYPAARMAEAFGPGLDLWDRVSAACWKASEWSEETALAELPQTVADHVRQLTDLGCPVDAALFDELREVERHLGAPKPRSSGSEGRQSIGYRVTITVSLIAGSWRPGFERLRDVVTKRRREWAKNNLQRYLEARWTSDLQAAVNEFHRHQADKGKPPTVKQFISRPVVSRALNTWLGGEIDALYALAGIAGGQSQQKRLLLPLDRKAFALAVIRHFGRPEVRYDQYGAPTDPNEYYKAKQVDVLGQLSLGFVQLIELHGREPTSSEFGDAQILRASSVLGLAPEQLWSRYASAVRQALADFHSAVPTESVS